jgi:hypothetical protein
MNKRKVTTNSPTSVIGERLGQFGGYVFSCLNNDDSNRYHPGGDESDLLFDIRMSPKSKQTHFEVITGAESSKASTSMLKQQNEHLTCDGCKKRIYPTDSITRAFSPTRVFHIGCFKCFVCTSTLKHHGEEVCVEIPDDDNLSSLVLLCHPCQQESLSKYADKTAAPIAGKRLEPESGDVSGVLKVIGDDLEQVLMSHYVPTCTICGGNFLSYESNKVVMLGSTLKYHYECWETGKPNAEIQQRRLDPIEAIKYIPSEVIVKFKTPKRVATLYFTWKNRLEDYKVILRNNRDMKKTFGIHFSLDQPSTSPHSPRKLLLNSPEPLYTFELVGNPFGTGTHAPGIMKKSIENISGSIQQIRFELLHNIEVQVPKCLLDTGISEEVFDMSKSTLIVNITE